MSASLTRRSKYLLKTPSYTCGSPLKGKLVSNITIRRKNQEPVYKMESSGLAANIFSFAYFIGYVCYITNSTRHHKFHRILSNCRTPMRCIVFRMPVAHTYCPIRLCAKTMRTNFCVLIECCFWTSYHDILDCFLKEIVVSCRCENFSRTLFTLKLWKRMHLHAFSLWFFFKLRNRLTLWLPAEDGSAIFTFQALTQKFV